MGLFRRRKALTGTSGVVDALNRGFAPFQLLGSGSRDRITGIYNAAQSASYSWLYVKSPALRTVVDLIVRDMGELDLCLYQEVSEQERQPRDDHPAALSLRYPDEQDTSDGLIRSLIKDWLIHDNAYAIVSPGVNQQVTIQHVPAYMIELQGNSLFRADNYRVWPQGAFNSNGAFSGGSGSYVDVPPENMLHWHGENPLDPRIGLSHLDTLRGVLAEDAALQQAVVELANSGLQEPVWVSRPLDAPLIGADAVMRREEDLTNRVRNRNQKIPLLTEGEELHSFGVTPHDAEMMDLRKWAVAQIAAEYGVPSGKVGLTLATDEDETTLLKDVLMPLGKNFGRMLDHRILVQEYDLPDYCFRFNMDERMMGDNRLQALTSAAGVPILLRDEARAMIGKPPVEGGDEPATPVNITLGGDPNALLTARAAAAAPKPGSTVMPIQDPNKPPQDGSYRQDDGATPVPSGNGGKALLYGADATVDPSARLPQLHPGFAGEIGRQRKNVETVQTVVQGLFDRIDRVAGAKAAISNRDWQRWEREFAGDLDKTLHGIVAAEGTIYSMKLGAAPFDVGEVTNYLRVTAEGAASALLDTVKGEIATIGADDAIARGPQHVASFGTSLGARATMWARKEAARQSGTFEARIKSWIADTGRHAEFNGMTVPLDADWPPGFGPGEQPGCGCTFTVS